MKKILFLVVGLLPFYSAYALTVKEIKECARASEMIDVDSLHYVDGLQSYVRFEGDSIYKVDISKDPYKGLGVATLSESTFPTAKGYCFNGIGCANIVGCKAKISELVPSAQRACLKNSASFEKLSEDQLYDVLDDVLMKWRMHIAFSEFGLRREQAHGKSEPQQKAAKLNAAKKIADSFNQNCAQLNVVREKTRKSIAEMKTSLNKTLEQFGQKPTSEAPTKKAKATR